LSWRPGEDAAEGSAMKEPPQNSRLRMGVVAGAVQFDGGGVASAAGA